MPQMAQDKRRVKVYSFGEELQWVDKGTGYVMCSYVDRLMALAIVVRSEQDGNWNLFRVSKFVLICCFVTRFHHSGVQDHT